MHGVSSPLSKPSTSAPAVAPRSLALPHRGYRALSIKRSHTVVGLFACFTAAVSALLMRHIVWGWQVATWTGLMKRFGITTFVLGKNFSWEQFYVMIDWPDMAVLSVLLFFLTWMVFRSPRLIPTVKGAYAVLVIPIFLYSLVVFLRNAPPAGPLGHIGPEWLYGELVLWCLVPLLYAVFVFPVPFSLSAKLSSLLIVLLMSIAWRTMAPVVYIMIAIGSQGLLSISAWMALGPWADYLYIIPVFAATLALYRGGRSDDYRA